MESCKYYDVTNGQCKELSDWRDTMPVIEYCVEGPCPYYESKHNTITVDAKCAIGNQGNCTQQNDCVGSTELDGNDKTRQSSLSAEYADEA